MEQLVAHKLSVMSRMYQIKANYDDLLRLRRDNLIPTSHDEFYSILKWHDNDEVT